MSSETVGSMMDSRYMVRLDPPNLQMAAHWASSTKAFSCGLTYTSTNFPAPYIYERVLPEVIPIVILLSC